MALTLKTLRDIEGLLTSDRMTYKGSEIRPLVDILNEIAREQAEAAKALRVVPNPVPWVDPKKVDDPSQGGLEG